MNTLTDLQNTAFYGRTFEELILCYGLHPAALREKRLLDVGSGPAAFVAEANRTGIEAIGVDPMYYRSPAALATLGQCDYTDMEARMLSCSSEYFQRGTFQSVEEAVASRQNALADFLEDYRRHFAVGRYVSGKLPELPFESASFDLATCGHFLFVYQRAFDFEFHLRSCLELRRVAREEVRIHPLVGTDGETYPHLGELRRRMDELGVESEVIQVDHAFFKGTDRTLVLR